MKMKRNPTPQEVQKAMETTEALWKPVSAPTDGMTAAQLAVQTDALRQALLRHEQIKTDCQHCSNYVAEVCELHGLVPVDFAKTPNDCADWRYDGIPF